MINGKLFIPLSKEDLESSPEIVDICQKKCRVLYFTIRPNSSEHPKRVRKFKVLSTLSADWPVSESQAHQHQVPQWDPLPTRQVPTPCEP